MSRSPVESRASFEPLEQRQFLSASSALLASVPTAERKATPMVSGRTLAARLGKVPTTMTVGANVNATRLSNNQLETDIAVNPFNPNNLVSIGVNQNRNGSALVVSRSMNGGRTWSVVSLGAAQDGLSGSTPRVDPHVAFDAFGTAYVVYMVASSKRELRIMLSQSTDGGATWTTKTAVSGLGLGIDYPFIAVGPDATRLSRQAVWVGFTDTRARQIKMVVARTTRLGGLGAFTAPFLVGETRGTYGAAAVGPAGEVAVVWQSSGANSGAIYSDVNTAGIGNLNAWRGDRTVATTNVGTFDAIPAQPDRTIFALPKVEFDRAPNSPTRGRLYMTYTDEDGNESNDTDIVFQYSDNRGLNWAGKKIVNDDNTRASQFLPSLAVDQTTGYVAVTWMDARNSRRNNTAELWGTVSVNRGASFFANRKISAGASYEGGADGYSADDLDFGDYAGLAYHGGRITAVWVDNSNSTRDNPDGTSRGMDIYTAVITVA